MDKLFLILGFLFLAAFVTFCVLWMRSTRKDYNDEGNPIWCALGLLFLVVGGTFLFLSFYFLGVRDYNKIMNTEKETTAYIKVYGFNEDDMYIIDKVKDLQSDIDNFNSHSDFWRNKEVKGV